MPPSSLPSSPVRANAERNFQMAEAKWPVCQEEAKANVHRPWPCAADTADRPLHPGRLPSHSERIAWERAGAQMGRRGPIPFKGLWLCCVGRSSLGGKKGSHPFLGIGLPPRLARDPSALAQFRKFISAFALVGNCSADATLTVATRQRCGRVLIADRRP